MGSDGLRSNGLRNSRHEGDRADGRRPGGAVRDRGMVTAELAVGLVVVVLAAVVLAWGLHLVVRQMLLEDAVAEVARQVARGDEDAVDAARAEAPPGARISVREGDRITVVTGEVASGPPGRRAVVTLRAEARVLTEPELGP